MIERSDLLALNFYKKSPFTGSMKNMRYRIEKVSEDDVDLFKATTYPKPFCFDATPDEDKTSETFEFSEDGLNAVCDWLNSRVESYSV